MSRTLYVSDMDGTLLGGDSRLSERSASMLNEAIGQGALFTVATARTPATVAPLLSGVDLRLPAVVMTGAATWHRQTGHFSDLSPIPTAEVESLLEVYGRHRLPTFVYTLRHDVVQVYHTGALTEGEKAFIAERSNSPYKRFHVPADGLSEAPYTDGDVLLLFAMRPNLAVRPVADELALRGDCTPVYYHDMYGAETAMLEVFSRHTSKAEAVRRLAGRVEADRIVAFGDNVNDLPLLEMADVAVAVGNAVPRVKEMADVVTGDNTEDAVARFILADILRN